MHRKDIVKACNTVAKSWIESVAGKMVAFNKLFSSLNKAALQTAMQASKGRHIKLPFYAKSC